MTTAAIPGRPPGDPPLRARHTELTRGLILDATVALIVERGVIDFSIQDVAGRAGVSHRTIYRHFPTREGLLEAVVPWGEAKMAARGGMALPEHPDDLARIVRSKYEVLDEMAPLVIAALKLDAARLVAVRQSARSRQATRSAVAEVTGHLPAGTAEAVAALFHQVTSSRMWLTCREDEGIDGARFAPVAAWAVETLIADLRAGRGPGLEGS